MKVLSIYNRKGGVGKTSLCAMLARFYGDIGKKVLCIDLDSQLNLTSYMCGLNDQESIQNTFKKTIENIIYDEENINNAIYRAGEYQTGQNPESPAKTFKNVFFIPGSENVDKRNTLLLIDPESIPQYLLKHQLKGLDDSWDIILQDCSPGENLLSVMSLVSSDFVLEPITPDLNAIMGLNKCRKIISKVQTSINPDLIDLGCILNNFKARESLSQMTYETLVIDPNCTFNKLTIRSASKVPSAILLKESVVNTDRYLKGVSQSQKVAEDVIRVAEYIIDQF